MVPWAHHNGDPKWHIDRYIRFVGGVDSWEPKESSFCSRVFKCFFRVFKTFLVGLATGRAVVL